LTKLNKLLNIYLNQKEFKFIIQKNDNKRRKY
jgi:hypothetical protein